MLLKCCHGTNQIKQGCVVGIVTQVRTEWTDLPIHAEKMCEPNNEEEK